MQWSYSQTYPDNDVGSFAYGSLDLSVSSVIFCAHRKSIQLLFPDKRKGSKVMSDQYFILDHHWALEGKLPVWCGEIQYTAWPPVSAVHPSWDAGLHPSLLISQSAALLKPLQRPISSSPKSGPQTIFTLFF